MGHQVMFRAIEDYDRGLFWLNSLFLMCIAFLPFPTSLLGEYGDQQLVVAIYAGSLAVARPLLIAAWRYATNRRRLVADDLDRGMINQGVPYPRFGRTTRAPDLDRRLFL